MLSQLKANHGVVYATAIACFVLLGLEFAFGICHLVTLWAESGGIIWFQLFTWAIAVAPLTILALIFWFLHSQRGIGQ
jgi:hypothetical protein